MTWHRQRQSRSTNARQQPQLGLTSAEARRRLAEFGPNAVSEQAPPRWRVFLAKFWGPIPWMLEAAIVLQLGLGAYVEAAVIGGLLLFNATLGFIQEGRASAALAALKKRLAPTALVRRDGEWVRLAGVGARAGRRDQAAARRAGSRRRDHHVGLGDGRPVDAHRRIRSGRCESRQPGLRGLPGAPRPGDRRSDGDRIARPISGAPPNSCASPTPPAPSRQPFSR